VGGDEGGVQVYPMKRELCMHENCLLGEIFLFFNT
jgi:hypothetical protein